MFDFFCYSHKQNFNGIAGEIEIGVQEERKPAAGEIFLTYFVSNTQNTNGMVSETEVGL